MPILRGSEFEFISRDEQQSYRLGIRIGRLTRLSDVLCLCGDISTGKTVIARGIGIGWGYADRIVSAMNVIIKRYPNIQNDSWLYHIDCFRIASVSEAIDLGIEEIFDSPAVIMIEWADKIKEIIPTDSLWLHINAVGDDTRSIKFSPGGARSMSLLSNIRKELYHL